MRAQAHADVPDDVSWKMLRVEVALALKALALDIDRDPTCENKNYSLFRSIWRSVTGLIAQYHARADVWFLDTRDDVRAAARLMLSRAEMHVAIAAGNARANDHRAMWFCDMDVAAWVSRQKHDVWIVVPSITLHRDEIRFSASNFHYSAIAHAVEHISVSLIEVLPQGFAQSIVFTYTQPGGCDLNSDHAIALVPIVPQTSRGWLLLFILQCSFLSPKLFSYRVQESRK